MIIDGKIEKPTRCYLHYKKDIVCYHSEQFVYSICGKKEVFEMELGCFNSNLQYPYIMLRDEDWKDWEVK